MANLSNINNKFLVTTGGDVGIGVTSPSQKLHVVGNVFLNAGSAYIASYNNTTNYQGAMRWSGLQLGNNGTNRIVAGRTATGGSFQFWTNNTNDASDHTVTPNGIMTMSMLNTGNVGIGTISPASVLHIKDNSASPTQLSIQSNDFSRAEEINFLNPSTSAISGQIKYYTNPTVEYMSFSTSNNSAAVERIRIKGNGNVGIGTASPDAKLTIYSTATYNSRTSGINIHRPGAFGQFGSLAYNGAEFQLSSTYTGNGATNWGTFNFLQYNNGSTNRSAMFIESLYGNVGIGTTSPSERLSVDGNAEILKGDDARLYIKDVGDSSTILLRSDGVNTSIGTDSNHNLQIQANGSTKMLVESSGRILFNSTGQPPISNSLYGNIVLQTNAVTNYQRIRFDVGTTAYWGLTKLNSGNFAITGGSTWNDHAFSIQYSTQNVGVGMSSGIFPGKFNVAATDATSTPGVGSGIYVGPFQGNSAVGSNWSYSNAGNTYTDFCSRYNNSGAVIRFIMKASATPVYAMTIKGSGNVGIGTDSPNQKLQVAGKTIINSTGNYTSNAGSLSVNSTSNANGGIVDTHSNGAHRYYTRVCHGATSSGSAGYWHIKTNITIDSSTMFLAKFYGYVYGQAGIMDLQHGAYAYNNGSGGIVINQGVTNNSSNTGMSSAIYTSTTGNKLCFRIDLNGSTYYAGLWMDIGFQNPTGGSWDFVVEAATFNATANYY